MAHLIFVNQLLVFEAVPDLVFLQDPFMTDLGFWI